MPAISPHHTDVVDKPWDGPENEKKLRIDESESYYRKMYAWQDPDKNPRTKSAYKFPHHMVSSDGEIGPANIKACVSIIAILNGGMGGADIPNDDREGVWKHAATHLKDADVEPAELKKLIMPEREVRKADIRISDVIENTDEMIVEGRAIVFDSPTAIAEVNGQTYYEVILSGSLDGADMKDVPFKYNHSDHVMIMARTRNKTLELIPDEKGLLIRAKLANTTAGRDLYELIRRGDIDKMSFAFTVAEDEYDFSTRTRKIKRIKKIWDVSAVDVPAYDDTYIATRKYLSEAHAIDEVFSLLEKEKEQQNLRKRKLYLMTFIH